MEINTKSSRMYGLIALYDMHSDFFKKALVGISAEDSHKRLDTKANHIAWIAGSLVQERFETAELLGIEKKQSAYELFKNHQGIKEGVTYPAPDEYIKDWESISPLLREALLDVDDAKLDSIYEMPEVPEMKMSYYELISFIIYREANMIGQIALWRRLLGYEALKYD